MSLNLYTWRKQNRKILALCCAVIMGVLLVSGAWGYLSLNVGFINLTRVEIGSATDDSAFLTTQWWLQQAERYPAVRQRALRGLGLLWEERGMTDRAQIALEQARDLNPEDPLVRLVLGDLYDRTGNISSAIAEYAVIGYRSREYETAVNYLDLLDQEGCTGDDQERILYQVLEVDPENIVAAYGLAVRLDEGNEEIKSELVWQIQHFPMRQGYQSGRAGRRMSVHLARVVPEIVDHDIWDLSLALRVADWWIRVGYYDAAEIALTGLLEYYPSNPSVGELLARTYCENGKWEKAIASAEDVLAVSPDSEAAHRCMAASYDAWGDIAAANVWYERYRQLAPDDWWGADLSPWQYEVEVINVVASLLQVSPTDVTLGANELSDVSFEIPNRWRFEAWTPGGAYGARGTSLSNNDIFTNTEPVLRRQAVATVCGLWRDDAYAGIKLQEPFPQSKSGAIYVLSFLYQVDGDQRYQCTVRGAGPFAEKYWPPSTGGQWRLFVAVGADPTAQGTEMSLTLINGGVGCLDVVGIELREVLTPRIILDNDVQYFAVQGYNHE